jgi:hypothetical protein
MTPFRAKARSLACEADDFSERAEELTEMLEAALVDAFNEGIETCVKQNIHWSRPFTRSEALRKLKVAKP